MFYDVYIAWRGQWHCHPHQVRSSCNLYLYTHPFLYLVIFTAYISLLHLEYPANRSCPFICHYQTSSELSNVSLGFLSSIIFWGKTSIFSRWVTVRDEAPNPWRPWSPKPPSDGRMRLRMKWTTKRPSWSCKARFTRRSWFQNYRYDNDIVYKVL